MLGISTNTTQKQSCTHSMAHAKLVRYVVTMRIQLIHVLYFQEHACRARRKYIPGIIIGRVREPKAKHLGGRGNYNNTPSKTITIKSQIIDTLKNGRIHSQVLTTGSLIASALYIVIPGSSLIGIKISEGRKSTHYSWCRFVPV